MHSNNFTRNRKSCTLTVALVIYRLLLILYHRFERVNPS
jgi:hypothetical protein